MPLRSFVTFQADFPDDAEWPENGSPQVPGGKGIMSCIRTALERKGIECSEPERRDHYGWEFGADCFGVSIWCLIQVDGDWLLITEVWGSFGDWVFRRKHEEEHGQFIQVLHAVLRADGRFKAIKWFTKQEYESSPDSRGSAAP